MIKKIIVCLIVVSVVAGGTWYLLSNSPAKSIEKFRKKINTLLKSKDSEKWHSVTTPNEYEGKDLDDIRVRIDIARQASDTILGIFPNSEYDLGMRGMIEEYAGDSQEALKWYDRISSLKNPPAVNERRRARLLEKMGLFQEAKGAVSAIVDVYPFESNFDLGRLHLETFQALEAYRSFNRAKEYASNENELRQVLEGIANSTSLLISLTHNQLERLKRADVDENQIITLTNVLKKLKKERDDNLDSAIELLSKVEPASRGQFVGVQIKKFELITKKDDADKLKTAQKTLIDAVSNDEDLRYFPIYLLLGSVDLKLGYGNSSESNERKGYIKSAIESYQKVFAFDFEGKTAKVADIAEWNLSEHMSKEEFQGRVLLRICQNLLNYPEYWRILSSQSPDGQKDPLDIHHRIQSALEANKGKSTVAQEIKYVQAMAALKHNETDTFRNLTSELLNEAGKKRPELSMRLAKGIATIAPDHFSFIIEMLDQEVFGKIESFEKSKGKNLAQLRTAINILNQARYKQYLIGSQLRNTNQEEYQNNLEKVDRLTQKIHDSISVIVKMSTTPSHFLLASKLMSSLIGTKEALAVLKDGNKVFPDDFQIRHALGLLYLDSASKDADKSRWDYLHDSAKEFLFLYKAQPYEPEVLNRLLSIGALFRNNSESPKLDLKKTVVELFPKSSEEDATALSNVLGSFLQRDFNSAVSQLPAADSSKAVRPFLNLVGGISYLELANRSMRQNLAHNPVISGEPQSDELQKKFSEYYQQARSEFEAGLNIDNTYIPLRLELLKMDLNSIKPGEEVAKDLIEQLKDFRDKNPKISQIPFLLGQGLKKKREFLIATNDRLASITKVLSKERTAFRRAIKLNSSFSEAYIALAETYVIPWRLTKGPLNEHKNSYNKLGTPEFDVAISVLKSAPSSPQILNLIAQYYDAKKDPQKALEYRKGLVQLEPVTTNVSKVIQSYIDMGNFKGARDWLSSIDSSGIRVEHFDVTRNTLMAYISSAEAGTPALSDHKKNLLEESQIEQYREIIGQSKELGRDPPMLVVNNLAYLLASRGKAEEALSLIEPLVKKLRESKNKLVATPFEDIEDTYAWSLYKAGDIEKATKTYKDLCSKGTRLDIHLNFAQVLFDLKKYQQALDQVRIILNSDEQKKRKLEAKTRQLQGKIELALEQ